MQLLSSTAAVAEWQGIHAEQMIKLEADNKFNTSFAIGIISYYLSFHPLHVIANLTAQSSAESTDSR